MLFYQIILLKTGVAFSRQTSSSLILVATATKWILPTLLHFLDICFNFFLSVFARYITV